MLNVEGVLKVLKGFKNVLISNQPALNILKNQKFCIIKIKIGVFNRLNRPHQNHQKYIIFILFILPAAVIKNKKTVLKTGKTKTTTKCLFF